jgi:excinuclease UvrABC nuclease subunit
VRPLASILPNRIDFDPTADLAQFLSQIPAKWVVYLFTDADDQPIQLLCVKNLRASLKRRLGGDETIGPSRRVNYAELVRRVYWRRVDSAFEADLVYLDAARDIFPRSYRGMVGFDPAWFVHINPEHNFPRYVKTLDLSKSGQYIGPFHDKHDAARFIEHIEDCFDLCRYYNILVESPGARACAYKEMGKCPAPCDGTIPMTQYRRLIELSAMTAVNPAAWIEQTRRRMEEAAGELRFESAAKIRQYLEDLGKFGKGDFRHARRLEDFRYVSLQHGPRAGTAKLFLITPPNVEEALGVIDSPQRASEAMSLLLREGAKSGPIDEPATERIAVVADHLFRSRKTSGVFVRLGELEEKSLMVAWRELQKQKTSEETEDEGVVKELQQI